ncbi:uncharacterized protein Z519_07432 [Cladophialophora bantiana CBS 173.52]|uniref:Xylanolytic transcriptional activator regulatory domain-containing protein n=1 Tax=Cladophialophora bantiana (strain ATCC 10958 / CBS 173.52 / CDC B-1940 / NIH 8579) TaxID=1442370 RepID=A0A0D2ENA7_CLAB1|nr:uncharacterized protein Z519_07432 [Cladophialophora bantiana CBS 173.52]KIW91466.1 hypothetical protein Z519_07432 [Cladophialophora bantiana CBS 173.52]
MRGEPVWKRPHVRKRRRQQLDHGGSPNSIEPKKARRPAEGERALTPSQQPSYLGRADYISAHAEIDEDDATHYQSPGPRAGSWHSFEVRMRRNLSVLELPQGTLRQTLLRNFLQRCRPWMPLVNESDLDKFDAKNKDTLLVTSMLVAGSIVSSTPQAAEQGQKCYQRAKVLFYTNAEQNHLHAIMATIFLQWLNPSGPEHVSIDNSSFWLRISVALAHQLGLHREPDPRMGDAKLRRRIWWALLSRDNQIAASHGRPRAVNAEDSNVRPLRMDDFEGDDEDALLFMHFVQITSILGDMTEHYCRGTLSDRKKIDFEDTLRRWLKAVPPSLRLYHLETKRLNDYNFKSRQLHTLYFTSLIILFRHENRNQPPSPVSLLASSFISGIFEEYLTWEDISHLPVTSIFYLMVAALLQLSYQRFPSLATHRAEEIEIIRSSLNELKKRFPSAIGAERVVNQMMKHSTTLPETVQSTRIALTPEQEEFFSPFGPELCRKWRLVFESPAAGPLERIEDFAGVTQSDNGVINTGPPTNHHLQASTDPPQEVQAIISAESAWNSSTPFSFSIDDQNLFSDQLGLDSVGRWWWADWMPEADLDFLSRSL